ncbi:MAG: L-lactate dehydrogenase [Alphaproteobacteria bacterium]
MGAIASIMDFRAAARANIPSLLFDYIDGGSYAEQTLRANVADLSALRLRQRVMQDVSKLSTETELLGQKFSMPVGLGPVGFSGMYAHRGEVQAARAAHAAGIPFTLSTLSICDVEEVSRKSGQPIWYQFYMIKDRAFMRDLLQKVQGCGTPVLVFTVDLPVAGARYRDLRQGISAPPTIPTQLSRMWQGISHPHWLWDVQMTGGPLIFGNIAAAVKSRALGDFAAWVGNNFDASITWKDIAWIRENWNGPIVLKGVLDPEDAKQAVAAGVDGIVVSNHGGRQLDGALSTISALPPIVDAVQGDLPILFDGGIRSGLDVLRALASGAQACLLGRAWAYALAAKGQAGVTQMLSILRAELHVAMALTGCADVRKASRELLA